MPVLVITVLPNVTVVEKYPVTKMFPESCVHYFIHEILPLNP